ncbi:MAG: hypothetical protein DRJ41_00595 [Thermoprotei archaeon]|nr:MAG: hypothetical protein DRJ41_00595 [Thermoprotei archaeon]
MSESAAELKKKILTLLEEDREFRYAVAGIIGFDSVLKSLESLQEQVRSLQEQVAENTKAIRALQEQALRHAKAIEGFSRRLDALGARWGILSEKAFRNSMKEVLERYFRARVEKWTYYDKDGVVYEHPSIIEVDLVIRDREHLLIEVKSSVSKGDVVELKRIGELYERVRGIRPKLAVVSPYVDERAKEMARIFGIEIYTSVE